MDDRLWICCWLLGGAGFFAVLGALFGGVAAAVARMHGRVAQGFIGGLVADSLNRVGEKKLSAVTRAAVAGASDGGFFLAVVGGIGGAVAGYRGDVSPAVAVSVCCAAALLAVGAICFGLLAYGLVRAGVWCVGGVCAGAIVLAVLGYRLAGADGILYGTTAGALLGVLLGLLTGSAAENVREDPTSADEDEDDGERPLR